MKRTRSIRSHFSLPLALLLLLNLFTIPAAAAEVPATITPDDLVRVVADQTGLPRNMASLVDAGYITQAEKIFFYNHQSVTFIIALRILLPTFGVYPYPAEIYSDIYPCQQYPTGVYADARAAAIKCGIAVPDSRLNDAITVNEFNVLLRQLRYSDLSLPSYTGGCAMLRDIKTWNLHSARARNSLVIAYKQLPVAWRDDFIEQGWTIELDPPDSIRGSNGAWLDMTSYSGLTHYQNRTIYIMSSEPKTTAHEFVHYAARRAGFNERYLTYYYNREASNMASLLGTYSQTNPTEYFADFGACWILHSELHSTMRRLAPETSSLITDLISDYDDLVGRDGSQIIYYSAAAEP